MVGGIFYVFPTHKCVLGLYLSKVAVRRGSVLRLISHFCVSQLRLYLMRYPNSFLYHAASSPVASLTFVGLIVTTMVAAAAFAFTTKFVHVKQLIVGNLREKSTNTKRHRSRYFSFFLVYFGVVVVLFRTADLLTLLLLVVFLVSNVLDLLRLAASVWKTQQDMHTTMIQQVRNGPRRNKSFLVTFLFCLQEIFRLQYLKVHRKKQDLDHEPAAIIKMLKLVSKLRKKVDTPATISLFSLSLQVKPTFLVLIRGYVFSIATVVVGKLVVDALG